MEDDIVDRPEPPAAACEHEPTPWSSLPLYINTPRGLELVEPRDSFQVPFTPVALLTDNALTEFYDYATSNFQSMMYRSHYTHPRGRAPTLDEERDPLHSFAPWSSLPLPIKSLRGLGLVQPRGTIQMPFVPVDLLTNNAIRELYEEMTRILQRTINQIHFFLSDGRVPTYEEVQDNFITYMQSTYEAFGFTGDVSTDDVPNTVITLKRTDILRLRNDSSLVNSTERLYRHVALRRYLDPCCALPSLHQSQSTSPPMLMYAMQCRLD